MNETKTEQRSGKFRPEIEGLRSIAFLLVAVFHIWLNRVSGGVDVFFTVAGFLIATTLLGHISRYGGVRAGLFFSRLARRLLPAALTVIATVLILIIALLPYAMWRDLFTQVIASATYWQNWFLAFNAVDYLATDTTRSPLQHFWAMSIQGQFYLIWFVIFVLVSWLIRRIGVNAHRTAAIVIAVVVAASFVFSVIDTAREQQFAYFSTFTRVWEFGLGALVALGLDKIRIHRFVAAVISWVALLTILSVGVLLPVADLFPGYIALLPVLAACVILAVGNQEATWGASRLLLSARPLVWLGGLGYGVYLWHWPILIFTLEVQGRTKAGLLSGTAIILLSLVLAYLTKKFVEEPFARAGRSPRFRIRFLTLTAAVLGVMIVVAAGAGGIGAIDKRTADEQREITALEEHPCFGANALANVDRCQSVDVSEQYLPDVPSKDNAEIFSGRCSTESPRTELKPCTWGDPESEIRIALIGNSHAAVWFPAINALAEEYGWRLDTYFITACTFNKALRGKEEERRTACDTWNRALEEHLASAPPYTYVLTSSNATNSHFLDPGTGDVNPAAGVRGYKEIWQPLIDRGATILVLRDYPRTTDELINCALADPEGDCSLPLEDAQTPFEEEVIAVAAAETKGAELIDMADWFCIDGTCPNVIGNVHVYRDPGHFTETYGKTLAEPLLEAFQEQAGIEVGEEVAQ